MDPALEARLMDAMADPDQFAVVRALFDACLQALTDFSQMDESLFERLAQGEGRLLDDAHPAVALDNLRAETLHGLRGLLDFLDSHGFLAPEDVDGPGSDDMDFDLEKAASRTGTWAWMTWTLMGRSPPFLRLHPRTLRGPAPRIFPTWWAPLPTG